MIKFISKQYVARLFFIIFVIAATAVYAAEYTVKSVIDGDTMELVDGTRVRLIGIDTPESMKNKKGIWVFAPEPFSLEAKEYTRKLVSGGSVKLELDKRSRDKYKRLLAYVYNSDGAMINSELVKKGLASMYTYYPNVGHFMELRKLQVEAMRGGYGIWRDIKEISPNEAINHIGEFCSIKGDVISVAASGNKIYINFGKNYKRDFSAFIYSDNTRFFPELEENPEAFLAGKYVVVTGKIIDLNGPRMSLDNSSQIKMAE